jgi:hypothetical protein
LVRFSRRFHGFGEIPDFPVIFRGQISPCGIFWGENFSTGIDFKRFKNNLQGFHGNLYPLGYRGGATVCLCQVEARIWGE